MSDTNEKPPFRISEQSSGDYSGVLIEFSKEAFRNASRNWSGQQHVANNRLALSKNPVERLHALITVIEAIQTDPK